MNSSETTANFKITENDSRQNNSTKYSKKSNLPKQLPNKTSSYDNINGNSNAVGSGTDPKLSNSKQMSDQQWALFFILIFVTIAFLIAFTVNSLYTSYNEVNQATKEL